MGQQQPLLGLKLDHLIQLVRHLKHLVSDHQQRLIVFCLLKTIDAASGVHEVGN
jgi:hypothetical protein